MYKNKWNESMRVALFWCIRWNKKNESFMSLVCARKLWWWHYLCWYAPLYDQNIFLLCMKMMMIEQSEKKFDGNAYEYIISIRSSFLFIYQLWLPFVCVILWHHGSELRRNKWRCIIKVRQFLLYVLLMLTMEILTFFVTILFGFGFGEDWTLMMMLGLTL